MRSFITVYWSIIMSCDLATTNKCDTVRLCGHVTSFPLCNSVVFLSRLLLVCPVSSWGHFLCMTFLKGLSSPTCQFAMQFPELLFSVRSLGCSATLASYKSSATLNHTTIPWHIPFFMLHISYTRLYWLRIRRTIYDYCLISDKFLSPSFIRGYTSTFMAIYFSFISYSPSCIYNKCLANLQILDSPTPAKKYH